MAGKVAPRKRRGIFYGWWIVADATVIMALTGGVYFYGFSAFFMPLLNEFGWSRTQLSGAISVSRLESGIAAPLVGFMVDRFGPRILMIVGSIMMGVGFILLSRVDSIEMFYVVFILVISVGSSLGFAMPATAAVANWFIKKRSMAFGITVCGTGIGGLAVPILAWFINNYGWRPTLVGIGFLFIALGIPLGMVLRHRPEPYGYLPDGEDPESRNESEPSQTLASDGTAATVQIVSETSEAEKTKAEVAFTARQALTTSTFWLIALLFTLRQMVTQAIGLHAIPALQDMGYSLEFAASVLAAMTVLSVPARFGFGWLADRYDKRYIVGIGLMGQFLGLLIFSYADSLFMIVLFLLVYSPGYGGLVPMQNSMWGEYFGRKSFATISGIAHSIVMWGTIAGPVLAGYTFDVTGSYHIALLFFAFANLGSLALLFFVRRPRPKPEQKTISG